MTDIDQEQSVKNLLKLHSVAHLLKRDREQLQQQSHSIAFYHDSIDREKAEQLLKSKYSKYRHDGLFLLRDCTTSPHDFSLSVIYLDKCYHYKIQLIYDIYFRIDSGPQIAGIEALIQYYQKRPDGLACLLSNEFVVNIPPPISTRRSGYTNTLHKACRQGNIELVKQILSIDHCRPDVNAKDSEGSTALHDACYFGHDDIVRLLLKAGAHVLARDADGGTALHRAAAGNRPSTLFILINEGNADYEERNYINNWVPLHEAAYHNSAACCHALLENGAPLRARTSYGKTPLEIAEEEKSDDCVQILRDYKPLPAVSRKSDWLHETNLDRLTAKTLLESKGSKNGMFVVRLSSKNPKNYALSLYNEKEFFNYEIIKLNDTTYYIDDGPYFDCIEHLIDHYCRIPDGLPTTLLSSINRLGQIVPSRVQPLAVYAVASNTPLTTVRSKPTNGELSKQASVDETITKLNGGVQRGIVRRSTIHLPSLSPSPQATNNNHTPTNADSLIPFVDRRQAVGGRIRPFISELTQTKTSRSNSNGSQSSSSVKRQQTQQKRKSLQLTMIPMSQIQQTSVLGEGEFGQVWEGFYKDERRNGIPVAIKILKDYSYSMKQDFLREAEHMATLTHHCITKLYGIVDNDDSMMMVIELLPLGALIDYLWKYKGQINESRLKLWSAQITDGMAYVERKGIVHRDLAARNVLIQSNDQVKISDFGLSRRTEADVYMQRSDSKIPVKWYAPEAINYGRFTSKSDVWSFGVTVWEMFSYAATPYGDMNGTDVYYYLQRGKRLERPSRCPPSTYRIMLKCWEWDESKRPTFFELMRYFKNDPEYRDAIKSTVTTGLDRDSHFSDQQQLNTNNNNNNSNDDDNSDNQEQFAFSQHSSSPSSLFTYPFSHGFDTSQHTNTNNIHISKSSIWLNKR
ncbi:unnamed protein product [Didymodactylos carnosus]|uniref:Tyrosine-protein kinase n=1 Tax=Didymodactylos carnosus TaxID=1234261 RepID=A0A814EUK2_9BILA|nr:unnamed protein product [Didymodactylos carnosus]CAF0974194.1 unnamed protein product [Didymodactylos carnosus]CAF3628025.1 unnamed protein product [Didymodactylos carnosus]CAF3747099.1 unnamed protein product [Didymodactylos carnosus]